MSAQMSTAFLSYAREDSDFALTLAKDLKSAGACVWLDQLDISPGQHWDSAIQEALASCAHALVILSPSSTNSNNVMDEVSYALDEQKTVIPVLHKECTIPFRLRRLQYSDFRRDYQEGLKTLLATLSAHACITDSKMEAPALTEFDSKDSKQITVDGVSHGSRLLSRRAVLLTGAVTVATAVTCWSKRNQINWLLHPIPRPRRVVVLPAANLHLSTADASLLDGILESVTIQLARSQKLEAELFIVPPRSLRRLKVTNASEARGLFGANLLLSGSLRFSPKSLLLILQLLDTSTGNLLRHTEIGSPLTALYSLSGVTVGAAATLLDIGRGHWHFQPTNIETTNPDAYAAYQRGRGLLRGYGLPVTDQAIAELQKAVEFDPHFARAWASLADAYSTKFHLTKEPAALELAERTSGKAMDLSPDLSAASSSRARVELYQGLYDAAINDALTATRQDPDNADAQISLAETYIRSGKLDLANETYQQLSNSRPNDWMVLNDWADFCIEQADYERAEKLLREATLLAPTAALPWRNLGAVYLAREELEQANLALNRSIQLLPTGEAYTNLGTALFWLRKYRPAADAYLKAVNLNPQSPLLWRNLGDAYQMIGMNDKAKASWRKAADLAAGLLDLDPNNLDTLVSLALYRAKLGESVQALALLRRADAHPGRTVEQLFYEAQAYELAGKRDSALQLLRDCMQHGYSSTDIVHAPELASLRKDSRFSALAK